MFYLFIFPKKYDEHRCSRSRYRTRYSSSRPTARKSNRPPSDRQQAGAHEYVTLIILI